MYVRTGKTHLLERTILKILIDSARKVQNVALFPPAQAVCANEPTVPRLTQIFLIFFIDLTS